MKPLLSFLLIILSFSTLGQDPVQTELYLTQQNKRINSGEFLSIHDFKHIKIEGKVDTNEYQIQFVFIPFEGTIVVFSKKESEIETMDIKELLGPGTISEDNIKHVTLSIKKDELSPAKPYGVVMTRKLESAEDNFTEFTRYAKIGDGETSVWFINQALALDSTNLKFLNARAQLYFEMGDLETSKNAFTKISTSHPNYVAFSYLSLIDLRQGDYAKAKANAESSLEYASDKSEKSYAYTSIADAEAKLFKFESAYKNYKKALDLNPEHINALNNITTVLDEVNRSDEKVAYFEKILKIDSSIYLVHVNIGFQYLHEEKFELALKEFNTVLEINPDQAIALSNKAYALMKLNQIEDALICIDKSLLLDSTNSYAFRNKALILLVLKNSEAACEALNEALRLNFTQQYGEEVLLLKKENCE